MTRREPLCLLRGPTFLPNAIFKQLRSQNIIVSCRENVYVHLTTQTERELHDHREKEEGI